LKKELEYLLSVYCQSATESILIFKLCETIM